jgi:hypothetical protein
MRRLISLHFNIYSFISPLMKGARNVMIASVACKNAAKNPNVLKHKLVNFINDEC